MSTSDAPASDRPCNELVRVITAGDDALVPDTRAGIDRHLETCPGCPNVIARSRTVIDLAGRLTPDVRGTNQFTRDRRTSLCRAFRRRSVLRILAMAAVGVTVLGACGGDDDDAGNGGDRGGPGGGRTQEYVDAVSASIRHGGFDPAQADCMAAAVVEVVGVGTLTDADISPEELGDARSLLTLDVDLANDTAVRLGDAFGECGVAGPIEALMVNEFTDTFGTELPPDAAACLTDNLDDRVVTDAVARQFVDASAEHTDDLLVSAAAACPSVMTEVLLTRILTDLAPSAQACVADFVEDNPDLAARTFTSLSSGAAEEPSEVGVEFGIRVRAACPEVASVVS